MKWSEEETMRFVELYSEKECLSKKSSVNYRNKNMRKAAEEDIVNRMGKEGFGVTELKQKIKIMRTTYNQEALKVKKFKKSGGKPDDIYVPTVKWFRQMEEIMDSSTAENETESIVSQNDNEAFGKFIAASLDKLPPADSIMAQGALQRVIQKYRLNALNKSSSASEASALTAIQSPTLSRDSPPATTPAYSTDHPIMNEDTVANDDAAIADIISQAWNLTN
ncbi:unnamed protein product [Acanthoscelides obtectus]|uniref:MADF domain-containing protein n=1 Tax=Acanthoscelides obtectus TaxID=200917 RepID=A0A9P0LYP4_ACAOB|nr:unnamed protein product [Acanthoscelides obtectus]CAK1631285.1 hypothetical protein AOBTE_LOCUS6857 [Acanthoscelides obtectus]